MVAKQNKYGPEWVKIRKQILERDSKRCRKCGRSTDLECHHIIPLRQSGTNEDDNLITLCYVCHREWEVFEEGLTTPFTEWLALPPLALLLAMYRVASVKRRRTVGKLRDEVDA